jgi:hypothetical protein
MNGCPTGVRTTVAPYRRRHAVDRHRGRDVGDDRADACPQGDVGRQRQGHLLGQRRGRSRPPGSGARRRHRARTDVGASRLHHRPHLRHRSGPGSGVWGNGLSGSSLIASTWHPSSASQRGVSSEQAPLQQSTATREAARPHALDIEPRAQDLEVVPDRLRLLDRGRDHLPAWPWRTRPGGRCRAVPRPEPRSGRARRRARTSARSTRRVVTGGDRDAAVRPSHPGYGQLQAGVRQMPRSTTSQPVASSPAVTAAAPSGPTASCRGRRACGRARGRCRRPARTRR